MCGERNPLEFIVARDLSMTVGELRRRMSNAEWAEWRAFYVYEHAMRDLAARSQRRWL